MGPRRGWILILQISLVVGISLLGSIDPTTRPYFLAVLALTVAFLSASQDIVIDAYRTEILRPGERGPGASVVTVGARIALLTSGAVALILADHLPWQTVYALMAAGLGIGIVATLCGPEPEQPIHHPQSLRRAVIEPFKDFLKRKSAVLILLFVIFYKFGDAFAVSLATPFLINVGFTMTEIGTVFKGIGIAATVIGALAGGGIVAKIGTYRSLWIFGILQAISNLGFLAIAYSGASFPLLLGVIGFDQFAAGLGTAAFTAFLMALCDVQFTATQYALLTSVMAIARVTVGVPAGYVVDSFGWPVFFVISLFAAVPGLAFLRLLVPKKSMPT